MCHSSSYWGSYVSFEIAFSKTLVYAAALLLPLSFVLRTAGERPVSGYFLISVNWRSVIINILILRTFLLILYMCV